MKSYTEYEPSDIDFTNNPEHAFLGVAVLLASMSIPKKSDSSVNLETKDADYPAKVVVATFLNLLNKQGYQIIKGARVDVPDAFKKWADAN